MIVKDKVEDLLYQVEKPERYTGNEWNQIVKEWTPERTKILLAFPDVYEIGMSHLGIKILYHLINREDNLICERTFALWPDMEELLQREKLPLYSLESGHEVKDFDIFGFTLQYEMSYTNIVNMLELAGVPIYSNQRREEDPLVIAGGSTVYNPEPVAPFFDLIFIGEAEESIVPLINSYKEYKSEGLSREQILINLSEIPGVYVPSLYEITYKQERAIDSFSKKQESVKDIVKKQIVADLDNTFYPVNFLVPYMDIVHNRAVIEIARGCTRGCRFCAAGITYRPVRERKKETIIRLADQILQNTGYNELSLNSLSTVDYSDIADLVTTLASRYQEKKISISLPSLRIDEFSVKLARQVQKVRKTGLTFAPEAGSDRLRRIINKGVKEEDLYRAVEAAFSSGWNSIKLYFMIGLPRETEEDLEGIADMAKKTLAIGRKHAGNKARIQVAVSTFIPKPHTPFQWFDMIDKKNIEQKISFLKGKIRGRGLNMSWNDPELSLMEGIFARGDRRLAAVIESAHKKGARFDAWNEHFDFNIWLQALKEHNLDFDKLIKGFNPDQQLPWSHIRMGVKDQFLKNEYEKALNEELTPDCRQEGCTGCGINLFYPGADIHVTEN